VQRRRALGATLVLGQAALDRRAWRWPLFAGSWEWRWGFCLDDSPVRFSAAGLRGSPL